MQTTEQALCPWGCGKLTGVEADGTRVHLNGPAQGSFICHLEPDQLLPGEYCDCWQCDQARNS